MDASQLQSLLAKGYALTATQLGAPFKLYRPHGNQCPLHAQNCLAVLTAYFTGEGFGPPKAPGYGSALWWGLFDCSTTQPGDYLCGPDATYFIARQVAGLPIQCVQTNRVVTLVRPTAAAQSGYSGLFASAGELILLQWPASLLQAGSRGEAALPSETRFSFWTCLLPPLPAAPQVDDILSDDLSQDYTVLAAEESGLGWRLTVRQIGP